MALFKSLKFAAGIVTALLVCSTAQAAITTTDWYFGNNAPGKNYAGKNSQTSGSTGNTATATAWSSFSTSSSATYSRDVLSFWDGGVGVGNSNSPNHAVDNQYADEFVLLSFDKSVSLTSLQIGWPSNSSSYDTDLTIMAYTGNGGANPNGKTAAQLSSAGWEHVNDLFNINRNVDTTISNPNDVSSNYWLVGAYNEYLSPNGSTYRGAKDFFKLKAIAGVSHTPSTGVPLPTTAALFGLGLLALGRKKIQLK